MRSGSSSRLRLVRRKVRRQHVAAALDRGDEAVGDAAVAHMRDQRVDGALPLRLRHPGGDAVVGDDAGIALGQRDEDQDAGAVLLARDAADRRTAPWRPGGRRRGAPRAASGDAHARQAEQQRRARGTPGPAAAGCSRTGSAVNATSSQGRASASTAAMRIGSAVASDEAARQHADDLARRPGLGGADGGGDAFAVLLGNRHHQLPEAPPPPDEPPPPEKPPPPTSCRRRKTRRREPLELPPDIQQHVEARTSGSRARR